MQSQKRSGTRHVQNVGYHPRSSRSTAEKIHPAIPLTVLCALLPPLGILFTWKSNRASMLTRAAASIVGVISMTLIFIWFIRPNGDPSSSIRPIPATPSTVGYGSVDAQSVALPAQGGLSAGDVAPAPPAVAESDNPDTGMDSLDLSSGPDELGPESIVYAVTNNAVSYHRFEVCGTQTNNRSLTLQQALMEGLIPCENCIGSVDGG